jgi:hypothetical protein
MGSSGRTFEAVTNPSKDMLVSKITLDIGTSLPWARSTGMLSVRLRHELLELFRTEHNRFGLLRKVSWEDGRS